LFQESQEYSKKNLGFLGIYGATILSILSIIFSLDFAQPALDPALNLFIRFFCLFKYSSCLAYSVIFFFSTLSLCST